MRKKYGFHRVRKEILDVLELPFQYPELFPPGCPRRQGVLLYGPPGTVPLHSPFMYVLFCDYLSNQRLFIEMPAMQCCDQMRIPQNMLVATPLFIGNYKQLFELFRK